MLRRGIEKDLSQESPFKTKIASLSGEVMIKNIWRSREVKEFSSFCSSLELIELVRQVFEGHPFRFLQDTWFWIPKGCDISIPWHHDNIIDGMHYSIWISLTKFVEVDSLRFVAGSHNRGLDYMPPSCFSGESNSSEIEEYHQKYNKAANGGIGGRYVLVPSEQEIEESEEVLCWQTMPGDCIIFNSRVLHSFGSDSIGDERSGFVTRWIAEGSRIANHASETVRAIIDSGLDVGIE
jgi:ectoine hydroxylase-related dioxygenase (phytanoyl-CoA dioxygenase family)